jgi:hypothetical protein
MGSKVIEIKYSSPLMKEGSVVRSTVFVDEGKGQRAIDEIRKAVDRMFDDPKFVRGAFMISEVRTIWEETNTPR